MVRFAAEGEQQLSLEQIELNLNELIGFIGYSAFVASVLCEFAIAPELFSSDAKAFLARFIAAVFMAVAFFAVYFFSSAISKRKSKPLIVCGFVGVISLVCGTCFFDLPWQVDLVVIGLSGAGLGFIAPQWFHLISVQNYKHVSFVVAGGIGTGLVICFALAYAPAGVARCVFPLLSLLSVASMVCLLVLDPMKTVPPVIENKESDKRSKIPRSSEIMLALNYFQIGMVICLAVAFDFVTQCLAVAIVAAIVLSVDSIWLRKINERSLSQVTPSITTAAYAMLFLFGDTVSSLVVIVFIFLSLVYTVSGYAAMSEHVRMSKLSPLRTFAIARVYDYLCLGLGLACGFVVSLVAAADTFAAVQITVTIAAIYCFISLRCHKPRFPEFNLQEDVVDSFDPYAHLKKRCRVLADRHGLSSRQHEVLLLIAQGRNAKYVQQVLTISYSTAQTHIRNVYGKLGVHSRQELLDLIDRTKLYGED